MQKAVERVINLRFPELESKLHLPHWGRVVALPELPSDTKKTSDIFYPRYAANIQLLDEHGENARIDILQAVPLPLSGVGNNAGRLEPPAIDSIVEIGFAYGRADKPFIRTILPFGWDLPTIKEGESRTQVREGVYQHIDEKGNFENKTDEAMADIIGKLAKLECATRTVTASIEQSHQSPKTWLGSDSENVLTLLSELMATVTALATTCAQHKHLGVAAGTAVSGVPDKAGDFNGQSDEASAQKARLDPITKG